MNELVDLIATWDIHPTDGLKEIEFREIRSNVGELDEGVLDRLVGFS